MQWDASTAQFRHDDKIQLLYALPLYVVNVYIHTYFDEYLLTLASHERYVCHDSDSLCAIITQGNPISGYRRLRDFGGKQMMSSSDSVCTYPLLMIKKVLLEDKQRHLYFLS